MTEVLDQGIDLIHWIEAFRTPALNQFFMLVTDLGSTVGYLLLLPVVWWAFSWKLGARVFVALVLSIYLNSLIKDVVALPRPFVYADVQNLRSPGEYSFPSGHAQQAALFWGLLALHFHHSQRRPWFSVVAAVVIFLVGFSRVYLGVHFPSDVVAGWVLGALLAWGTARWSKPLVDKAVGLGLNAQMALSLGLPVGLTLVHPSANAAMAMGALAGALGGLVFAYHHGLYPQGDRARNRRAWLIIGLVGLPIIYVGLRQLSPGPESAYYHFYLWVRFAAIGLWVSFLVPRLVSWIKA